MIDKQQVKRAIAEYQTGHATSYETDDEWAHQRII